VKVQRLGVRVLVALGVAAAFAAAWSPPAGAKATAKIPVSGFAVSAGRQEQLRALYAAYRHIPLADIGGIAPESVHGAQLSPGGAQWAAARFEPSASAPQAVATMFQDGAGAAIFTRPPGGAWRAVGLGGEPFACGTRLPSRVRVFWGFSGCSASTWASAPRAGRVGGTGRGQAGRAEVASVAMGQVGVSDNPAELNFNGLDCDPYTAIEAPWASTHGCGTDPAFNIGDRSELWCADFAKWVWLQAGVTSFSTALTPAAASFFTWGQDHHEGLRTDATNPRVGDAVVFYPTGTPPNGRYADHVGIITAVNPDGSIDIVNGDFLGPQNISVESDVEITSLGEWAAQMWNANEQWVFVKPRFPHTPPPPPPPARAGSAQG
jgi:hypothetical protein